MAGTYGTFTFNTTTGVWSYALDNSKPATQELNAGDAVSDSLTVKSFDGTDTETITVNITGSNDKATITASDSEDTAVLEAGYNVAGDSVAGGTLSVADVDAGEEVFQTPASLAGTYGTFTFNTTTGVWSYALDNSKPATQELNAGDAVSDSLTVKSFDGTDTETITVNITGSNDKATITASDSEDTAVLEAGYNVAGDSVAGGTLSVADVDAGEEVFQTPASLAGTYGTFTFNTTTGVWSYALDNSKPATQELNAGDAVSDSLTVKSFDGTDTETITVNITGSNDKATITASDSEDTAVLEAGYNVAGDSVAGGTLSVADVDAGEEVFQTPASLAGTYGTFTFNTTTGVWSYALDNSKPATQELNAGDAVSDSLTVKSFDGTDTETITVNITGSNDKATITASDSEDTAVLEAGYNVAGDSVAGGTLSVADVDAGEEVFQTPASLAGTYGTFTFNTTTGVWSYALDNSKPATQELNAGDAVSDSLTVKSFDGTDTETITVNITGSNDKATITASDSEDTAVLEAGYNVAGDSVAGGTLSVADVDAGEEVFQTPASLAGTYGTFTFNTTTGVWSYALDNSKPATQELNAGDAVSDSLTVKSFDGTDTETITVNITGSNDKATITASDSEDTAVLEAGYNVAGDSVAGGTLSVADVDAGEEVFQTPASLAGTYGTFTFNTTTGVWSYALDNSKPATQELNAGDAVSDSLTVKSFDGTDTETITVNITGSNDKATITASDSEDTAVLEAGYNVAGDSVAGGTLSVADVDAGEEVFQTPASLAGTYGTFTFNTTTGVWSYALDNSKPATQELNAGDAVSDSLTVKSFDGTDTETITVNITGSNDKATITASDSEDTAVLEAGYNVAGDSVAGGTLSVADVDAGEEVFQTPASLAGTYGTFTFNTTTGVWSYALDNSKPATQELNAGDAVSDSLTVKSFDGTDTETITVNITGSNDLATISGTNTGSVTEDTDAVLDILTETGTLTVADVDAGENIFSTTVTPVGTVLGSLSITADGAWTYTIDNTLSQVQALGSTGSFTESFTVKSVDSTDTETITVTVKGTDDAPTITVTATDLITEDAVDATTVIATSDANDVDNDNASMTYAITAGTDTNGYYEIDTATGTVTLSAAGIAHVNDGGDLPDVDVTVSSNGLTANDSDTPAATIPTDDPTVAVDDTVVTDEDVAIDIDVLANDTDDDGAVSAVASVTDGTNGTVTINEDGTVKYTPNENFNGDDTFTYTNADGDTATVNVTVNPVADFLQGNELSVLIGEPLVNTGNIDPDYDEDDATNIFSFNGLVITSSTDILRFVPGTGIGVDTTGSSNDGNQIDYTVPNNEMLTVLFPNQVTNMALEVKNIVGDEIKVVAFSEDAEVGYWLFTKISNNSYTATFTDTEANVTNVDWTTASGNASDYIYLESAVAYDSIVISDNNVDGGGFSLKNIFDPRIVDNTSYTYPFLITAEFPSSNTDSITSIHVGELPADTVLQVYNSTTGVYTDLTPDVNGMYDIPLSQLDEIVLSAENELPVDFKPFISAVVTDGADVSTTIFGGSGGTVITGTGDSDYIDGRDGSDTIDAKAGDDTIIYDSIDVSIDGGIGNDTLIVSSTINLSNVDNIEIVELKGGATVTGSDPLLGITAADVLGAVESDTLIIQSSDGNAYDQVNVHSSFGTASAVVIDGQDYAQYVDSGATLLIAIEDPSDIL
ncbi:outer membrane adhesin-like protein [Sulfurimonas gotlandica GD1]|uniref:Outer membrane adhesin-like protein n=1 Tax=Sulfurimonas gotlandica (strain DSM 19862 / JCM 16533 / GD1) TaxID=929558 RepID=H1FUQ7_SULGG|nr:outer membrane adhesin-like protein [Sulfurimonas gotlandica GD1]